MFYIYIILFAIYSWFFAYPTPGYGNCYAFNKDDIKADPEAGNRKTSLTGPKFGLTLVLNIGPEGYMTNGRTEQVTGLRNKIDTSKIFGVSIWRTVFYYYCVRYWE